MERLNYLVFDNRTMVNGDHPSVGDVVSVRTFAGKGITAQVIGDEHEGYCLKYPSVDGLQALRKTVPHYWRFERIEKTLPQIAARRFWASRLSIVAGGAEFRSWEDLPIFVETWGDPGLHELLVLVRPTLGAEQDFAPHVRLLGDRKLVERLVSEANHPQVREAATLVLSAR